MTDRPPMPPKRRSIVPWLLAVLVIAIGALAWLLTRAPTPPVPPVPPVAPSVAPAPPSQSAAPQEPAVKHPIESVAVEPAPRAAPLPPLDKSDDAVADALGGLIGRSALAEFFLTDSMVRRFVATVDGLPRDSLSMRIRAVRATPGSFLVAGAGDERSIAPDNSRRYEPFVRFVERLDARRLVSLYVRFYPLFQQEYQALGYPNRQFNDRVVEAIDDMIDAPEPKPPVAVTQPKVLYEYADADLQSMSAGRRIMVRVGADNERRLKAKLREIHALLVNAAPQRPAR